VEQSPFPYQGPLRPEEVRGRIELRRDLAERLVDRRVTALLGPRRYGKTSVLRRVVTDLAAVGPEPIWIDFFGMASIGDVAGAVDRGLSTSRGRLRTALDSVAAGLSVNLGVVGVELSRSRRDRPDPTALLWSLLEVLVETAGRQDTVVVFDEFSGLAHAEGATAILRTALQHHYRDMGIVFAGSDPSTMRMLFADSSEPFFAQADLVEIGPMPDDELTEIIQDGFATTGRDPGPVTARVVALSGGHPQRSMQLADAAWRATDPGTTATAQTWEAALADVRASVDSGFERLFSLLPPGQQKTIRVLAVGGSVYGTAGRAVDLPAGTATAAVAALVGNGFLARSAENELVIVDPLLGDWLRRRFTG
jgi:uncharacterized protein